MVSEQIDVLNTISDAQFLEKKCFQIWRAVKLLFSAFMSILMPHSYCLGGGIRHFLLLYLRWFSSSRFSLVLLSYFISYPGILFCLLLFLNFCLFLWTFLRKGSEVDAIFLGDLQKIFKLKDSPHADVMRIPFFS